MAVVIKTSTDAMYAKVMQITDALKDLSVQLTNINGLENDLASRFWVGDAANYNVKEVIQVFEELQALMTMLGARPGQLFQIADMYDRVEAYNKEKEAGALPTDFLK